MPYYFANKQPIFLTWNRYKKIKRIALKDKSPEWRIDSMIAGNSEVEEADKLISSALSQEYFANPDLFQTEWSEFNLEGKEAQDNAWELLYDYCRFSGNGYLSDLRDFHMELIGDYMGDAYINPMGRVYSLNFRVRPCNWWFKLLHALNWPIVRIVVDSCKVKSIKGSLKDFEINFGSHKIVCNENIQIS